MKKFLLFILVVVALSFSIAYAEAAIYVENFENTSVSVGSKLPSDMGGGAANGTAPTISADYAYSGDYSLKAQFNPNSTNTTNMGVKMLLSDEQKALLVEGTEYTLSAKIYYTSTEKNSISLTISTLNGTGSSEVEKKTTTIAKDAWKEASVTFTYNAASYPDGLNFRFVSGAIGTHEYYYVDNIIIKEKALAASQFSSRNIDFEDMTSLSSTNDYALTSAGNVELSSDLNHTDDDGKSMVISNFTSGYSRVCLKNVFDELDEGMQFYVQMYVYPETDGKIRIGVKGDTASNSYWANGTSEADWFELKAGEWNEVIFPVTIAYMSNSSGTETFLTEHITFDHRNTTEGVITKFYVDDIKIFQPHLFPAAYFNDHAVFQRDKPIPVWGTHKNVGAQVSVTFNGKTNAATVQSDGSWKTEFDAMDAQTELTMIISDGDSTFTYEDIAIGELILCAGQSNMQIKMNVTKDYDSMKEICENYDIRFFEQDNARSFEKQKDVTNGTWILSKQDSLNLISGLPYYVGYYLHEYLGDVPIGLVDMAYGGTAIECWLPEEVITNNEELSWIKTAYNTDKSASTLSSTTPTVCYNSMFYPMRHLPVKAILWYQGESNTSSSKYLDIYATMFDELVNLWRTTYNDPQMPIFVMQLAPYDHVRFAPIREIQFENTKRYDYMYCIATENEGPDGLEREDMGPVHPRNKKPIGYRIVEAMKANIYGESIEWCGPEYKSMTVKDNKAILTFDHTGTGMVIDDGKEALTGFEISEDGTTFVEAAAEIFGNTIIVSADGITNPVSVRYCYLPIDEETRSEDNCATLGGNLSNNTNIPAYPFVATPYSASQTLVSITDSDGNEQTLTAGIKDGIKLTVDTQNTGLSEVGAKLIVAYYKNNALSYANVYDSSFATKEDFKIVTDLINDENYTSDDEIEIKLYLWNIPGNLSPLDGSISIK